ncbi:MAG: hypothetical protein WCL43_08440 [Chlorobium sp.]|jgi:hypothetical protein|nr:MAG: hypothetical protein FDX12_05095 [Chlorobium sp.]
MKSRDNNSNKNGKGIDLLVEKALLALGQMFFTRIKKLIEELTITEEPHHPAACSGMTLLSYF